MLKQKLCHRNIISFIYNKRRDKEHKEKIKSTKNRLHTTTPPDVQSMTLKMFINNINNRQATITCITKT